MRKIGKNHPNRAGIELRLFGIALESDPNTYGDDGQPVYVVLELADGEERVLGPIYASGGGLVDHSYSALCFADQKKVPGCSWSRWRCMGKKKPCGETYDTKAARDACRERHG